MAEAINTPEGRVMWPYVFRTNKPQNPEDKAKYSIQLLFPKDANLKPLMSAVNAIMTEKFGAKETWPKKWRNPFRDQGEIEKPGYEDGCVFITASATEDFKPGVVKREGGAIVDVIDASDIYSGCWAVAQVKPFWYEVKGNKGVAFGLNHVCKMRDDKPLDGRMKASEAFKEFAGSGDEADGEGGGDDPFNMS